MESAGLHILMDARVADPVVFETKRLTVLFEKVVQALDMKPLDKVMVYEVPVDPAILARAKRTGIFEDEGGTSVIQEISTSHLSCHAWPLQKFFSLDAFSCKAFNAALAISIIRETLGITAGRVLVVEREKVPENAKDFSIQYVRQGLNASV
jgi:S-adenosylmethionine/arginine decarboxylase-like enzyme